MAKVEAIVEHPQLHLAVKGKLQHVKKGTRITVADDSRHLKNGNIKLLGDDESVEVGDDEAKAAQKAELQGQLKELRTKVKAEQNADAKAALEASVKELQAQIKAL